jgi:hypothetical protein
VRKPLPQPPAVTCADSRLVPTPPRLPQVAAAPTPDNLAALLRALASVYRAYPGRCGADPWMYR